VIGNAANEYANAIAQTSDGGFIVGGISTEAAPIGSQSYVLKFDAKGNLEWDLRYTGSGEEQILSLNESADQNGYIFLSSNVKDGKNNFLVTKIDLDSTILWSESYGNPGDIGTFLIPAAAGGYILCGTTADTGNSGSDAFVIKLSESGTVEWKQTYDGGADDGAYSIDNTLDGNYIFAGYSNSAINTGSSKDGWIVKISQDGQTLWQQIVGGSGNDIINNIHQTNDGGFILAGETDSSDINNTEYLSDPNGSKDGWITKLNETGDFSWSLVIGGENIDTLRSVIQQEDGIYIATGTTFSIEIPGTKPHEQEGSGYGDIWVMKLSDERHLVWQKCYGSTGNEHAGAILIDADGSLILAGGSGLPNGDVAKDNGSSDVWLLSLK